MRQPAQEWSTRIPCWNGCHCCQGAPLPEGSYSCPAARGLWSHENILKYPFVPRVENWDLRREQQLVNPWPCVPPLLPWRCGEYLAPFPASVLGMSISLPSDSHLRDSFQLGRRFRHWGENKQQQTLLFTLVRESGWVLGFWFWDYRSCGKWS